MRITSIFVLLFALCLSVVASNAFAAILPGFFTVEAVPRGPVIPCPNYGWLCNDDIEGVASVRNPEKAWTWDFIVTVDPSFLTSPTPWLHLQISYGDLCRESCLALHESSAVRSNASYQVIELNTTEIIENVILQFDPGDPVAAFTFTTSNCFPEFTSPENGHADFTFGAELITATGHVSVAIDSAKGYDVIPEPATMALLGLGALVLRRKKA